MNTIKLLLAAMATLGASAALASPPAAAPAVSRAEVLADLHMWHAAGLAAFPTVEAQQLSASSHQAARARYEALRTSPEYAALVKQLQGRPSTTLALRR